LEILATASLALTKNSETEKEREKDRCKQNQTKDSARQHTWKRARKHLNGKRAREQARDREREKERERKRDGGRESVRACARESAREKDVATFYFNPLSWVLCDQVGFFTPNKEKKRLVLVAALFVYSNKNIFGYFSRISLDTLWIFLLEYL